MWGDEIWIKARFRDLWKVNAVEKNRTNYILVAFLLDQSQMEIVQFVISLVSETYRVGLNIEARENNAT